jgi:hypothetical protein
MSISLRRLAVAALLLCGTAHAAIVSTASNPYEENPSEEAFSRTSHVPGLPADQFGALPAPPALLISRPSAGAIVPEGLLAPEGDYAAAVSGGATQRLIAFADAAIPEPGTMTLLLAGIACFGVLITRRR